MKIYQQKIEENINTTYQIFPAPLIDILVFKEYQNNADVGRI